MKTTIEMQMSATPVTITYSSTLASYRNTVNQRLPNVSTVKINNRMIQIIYSRGGRGGRGVRGHQGCGGRGGRGGRGRGIVSINGDWEVIELNGHTIRVHPACGFENDQWFNIPEGTRLQLTYIQRYYQSQKCQRTNAGIRTNSQCQQQIQVQQKYSYYQPVPETIIQLPRQPHGSIPHPPPPRQSEISQKSQQTNADDFITMTQDASGASITGGQN